MLHILAFNIYHTSPNIDKWVFHVSSVIMAIIGVVGTSSNLGVIGAYIRNKKVRKTSYFSSSLYKHLLKLEYMYNWTYEYRTIYRCIDIICYLSNFVTFLIFNKMIQQTRKIPTTCIWWLLKLSNLDFFFIILRKRSLIWLCNTSCTQWNKKISVHTC